LGILALMNFAYFLVNNFGSLSADNHAFALESRPPRLIVIIIVVVTPARPSCLLRPYPVPLVAGFKRTVCHDIRTLVEVFRAARSVFGYTLELLVGLECVVDGYYVKDD